MDLVVGSNNPLDHVKCGVVDDDDIPVITSSDNVLFICKNGVHLSGEIDGPIMTSHIQIKLYNFGEVEIGKNKVIGCTDCRAHGLIVQRV